jgi:branched-subunit amino acid transport protein
MATSYASAVVLALVAVIGVLTYAIRFSFIGLFGYLEETPASVVQALRFVPAAVFAALMLPAVVTVEPTGGLALDKLLAGAAAGAVAWRTENVLATMTAGMGVLWAVRFLL